MHVPAATAPDSQPAWDIARVFPSQGQWSESDYFSVCTTNHLVELVDGQVEVLEMPKLPHQFIARFLFEAMREFTRARDLGEVLFAPTFVRLWPSHIREPDILFLSYERLARSTDGVAAAADLAIEVVSPGPASHQRDWFDKRRDYAKAGIPEYWIVDPQLGKIVVLRLTGEGYEVHCEAGVSGRADSNLLAGFEIEASTLWASSRG